MQAETSSLNPLDSDLNPPNSDLNPLANTFVPTKMKFGLLFGPSECSRAKVGHARPMKIQEPSKMVCLGEFLYKRPIASRKSKVVKRMLADHKRMIADRFMQDVLEKNKKEDESTILFNSEDLCIVATQLMDELSCPYDRKKLKGYVKIKVPEPIRVKPLVAPAVKEEEERMKRETIRAQGFDASGFKAPPPPSRLPVPGSNLLGSFWGLHRQEQAFKPTISLTHRPESLEDRLWSVTPRDLRVWNTRAVEKPCSCPPMFGYSVPPAFFGDPLNIGFPCGIDKPHLNRYGESPDGNELAGVPSPRVVCSAEDVFKEPEDAPVKKANLNLYSQQFETIVNNLCEIISEEGEKRDYEAFFPDLEDTPWDSLWDSDVTANSCNCEEESNSKQLEMIENIACDIISGDEKRDYEDFCLDCEKNVCSADYKDFCADPDDTLKILLDTHATANLTSHYPWNCDNGKNSKPMQAIPMEVSKADQVSEDDNCHPLIEHFDTLEEEEPENEGVVPNIKELIHRTSEITDSGISEDCCGDSPCSQWCDTSPKCGSRTLEVLDILNDTTVFLLNFSSNPNVSAPANRPNFKRSFSANDCDAYLEKLPTLPFLRKLKDESCWKDSDSGISSQDDFRDYGFEEGEADVAPMWSLFSGDGSLWQPLQTPNQEECIKFPHKRVKELRRLQSMT